MPGSQILISGSSGSLINESFHAPSFAAPTAALQFQFSPWKIPWSRKWQPTLVFLSGKSNGQRSLVSYSQCGHKELDKTERLNNTIYSVIIFSIFVVYNKIHLLMCYSVMGNCQYFQGRDCVFTL